jgi:hypothetical protein
MSERRRTLSRPSPRAAWPGGTELKVRVGTHTGEADLSEETYVGLD